MTLSLAVSKLHWILNVAEDPADLCAHGQVDLHIDGSPIAGLVAYECTVSAAALYLLRSLTRPHEVGVHEHLFPCCGFSMFETRERDAVFILGCPNGIALDVAHDDGAVVLRVAGGPEHRVPLAEWREAVVAFADAVSAFYRRSPSKQPNAEDRAGFRAFLREWSALRGDTLLSPMEEARFRVEAAA